MPASAPKTAASLRIGRHVFHLDGFTFQREYDPIHRFFYPRRKRQRASSWEVRAELHPKETRKLSALRRLMDGDQMVTLTVKTGRRRNGVRGRAQIVSFERHAQVADIVQTIVDVRGPGEPTVIGRRRGRRR